MSIYQDLLNWSQSRPNFIKDALRRLISNTTITQHDIDELVLLLKKENGDASVVINAVPIDSTHIPTTVNIGDVYPRLISIKDPINICALHNGGHLQFASSGLTVVYGINGSGKSSYSRILKKLCWSRNSDIDLKKNVFSPSLSQQQVDFVIEESGTSTSFKWIENAPSHQKLSSIYVFDADCGDVYINKENPNEYKPIGIDILERLIPVLNSISQRLNSQIAGYNTSKPTLDQSLSGTLVGQWYAHLESKMRTDVDRYIQFSQTDLARKQELFKLINTQNPQQNIQILTSLKSRIGNYIQQLTGIEAYFSQDSIQDIRNLRIRSERTRQAYDIATNALNGLNTIEGFGTNPWRMLWDAARKFANSNVGMSDGQNFPSNGSMEKCVLCQQELDELAQQRLLGFNKFISDDVSTQLNAIQTEILHKKEMFSSLIILPFENYMELSEYISDFKNEYSDFVMAVNSLQNSIVSYLQNGGELDVNLKLISTCVNNLIPNIDDQVEQNSHLLHNRNALTTEYYELAAKEFLFNNKMSILQYYDEYKYKSFIGKCQAQLSTSGISRKIGEVMENQAVGLQHQEFLNHLGYFNQDLASKVTLSKTRTTQGSTYQKCSLNGTAHSIDSVLSEGEKRVIALSNFLAECTIDGRKNTIVFDDPVTSLDMDYRDLIANRIADLSKDRQIIVLTHDLSFLRLLMDTYKAIIGSDCRIIGIDKYNGISGVVTDEIPYLAKNVQERIDSIRRILTEHDALQITDGHGREIKLDSARKRVRMLVERSVEEILSNKTYERFSKNIHLKKFNLSSYVVAEQSDVDFLLALFGKYSVTEHDGGTSTIPQLPSKATIEQDIKDYSAWKDSFKAKLRAHTGPSS